MVTQRAAVGALSVPNSWGTFCITALLIRVTRALGSRRRERDIWVRRFFAPRIAGERGKRQNTHRHFGKAAVVPSITRSGSPRDIPASLEHVMPALRRKACYDLMTGAGIVLEA